MTYGTPKRPTLFATCRESCPSGRRSQIGNLVWAQVHRGFDSHTLRSLFCEVAVVDLCAVLAQPEGKPNFLVAILPRPQAVKLCRQCSEAALCLVEAGLLPLTVSHRILDVPYSFPFYIVESRSWGTRNFFSFCVRDGVLPAIAKEIPGKRELVIYRIESEFSFPPLNDFMNRLPREIIHTIQDGELWLEKTDA